MAQLGQIAPTEPPLRPADLDQPTARAAPALVFRAGDLLCAVPVAELIEIMRPLPIHRLAGVAPFVAGLTIMRGRAAPVIDVAQLLTGTTAPASRFVAVRTAAGTAALATGQVVDILPVGTSEPPPAAAAARPNAAGLVYAVGTTAGEPLFLLHTAAMVADRVWQAVAAQDLDGRADPGQPAW